MDTPTRHAAPVLMDRDPVATSPDRMVKWLAGHPGMSPERLANWALDQAAAGELSDAIAGRYVETVRLIRAERRRCHCHQCERAS